MANMLLSAMKDKTIDAVIGRAPEFCEPDLTQHIKNSMIFNHFKEGKRAIVPWH